MIWRILLIGFGFSASARCTSATADAAAVADGKVQHVQAFLRGELFRGGLDAELVVAARSRYAFTSFSTMRPAGRSL